MTQSLPSDSAMFSSLVDPEARFVRTGYQMDGSPDVTSYPKEYFVSTLKKTQKGVLAETVEQPFVQMRDNLAHVWCRFEPFDNVLRMCTRVLLRAYAPVCVLCAFLSCLFSSAVCVRARVCVCVCSVPEHSCGTKGKKSWRCLIVLVPMLILVVFIPVLSVFISILIRAYSYSICAYPNAHSGVFIPVLSVLIPMLILIVFYCYFESIYSYSICVCSHAHSDSVVLLF
jgi:hypothetical protein